jgi:GGDEF domain-containing protein
VASKVLGQHIHHPRAARQKFVSVSVGAASVNPTAERGADTLVHAVMRALERAKQDREARVAVAVPEDMQGTN